MISEKQITKRINKKRIPVLTEAVCMAANPPPSKSAIATKPSIKAQKIRCATGASNFPPEVILSITKDPLSEEVTKNTETINIPTILVKVYSGNA